MHEDRIADIVILVCLVIPVCAKLFGWITWSWLWVFAPIWIPFTIFASILSLTSIYYIILTLLKRIIKR